MELRRGEKWWIHKKNVLQRNKATLKERMTYVLRKNKYYISSFFDG
jgi:hypothetical protein